MSSKIPTRRSQRLLSSKLKVQTESYRVQKPIHNSERSKSIQTTMRSKRTPVSIHTRKTSKYTQNSKANVKISHLIEESASESDWDSENDTDMTGSDDETDDEFNELADLSADNIAFITSDLLDRRGSCDSRYEPGNEEYDLDGFVVGDDYDTEDAEVDSEETDDEDDEDDDDTPVPQRTINKDTSIADWNVEDKDEDTVVRKVSTTSTQSSSSALFVSESENPPKPLPGYSTTAPSSLIPLLSEYEHYMEMPITSAAPADIAEDIMDAISLFSRRCNRMRTPLRIRLSIDTLEDEEVSEALQTAEELCLGRGLGLEDGSEGWVVGPRK